MDLIRVVVTAALLRRGAKGTAETFAPRDVATDSARLPDVERDTPYVLSAARQEAGFEQVPTSVVLRDAVVARRSAWRFVARVIPVRRVPLHAGVGRWR